MRLGIIDIGSNSMRLVIYEVQEKSFKIIGQIKRSARLGQGMKDGYLNKDRLDYAISALESFKGYLDSRETREIIAVATEAVRKSKNKEEFLSKAKVALGREIKVLSGEEEAFYDYYATVNTLDLKDCLMFDIGGSSMEIVHIENRILQDSVSIPFGSISLTEKYNLKSSPKNEARLAKFLESSLNDVPWLKNAAGLPLVGIGGSVRTLGKIDRYRKDYAMFIAHNYSLEKQDVDEIYGLVRDYICDSGKKVAGLGRDREDIFIGSVAAVGKLMEKTGSKKLFVSGAGVRDGLLFEYILGGKKRIRNVLDFSLDNIINIHMYHDYEGRELFRHAAAMYAALCRKYPYLSGNGKVLKTAAYLYDIGTSLNYFQRDRNTFYSILNAPINGISQKQILMAAAAATTTSNNDILRDYFSRKMLTDRDIATIEKLGMLIKAAEAINHGRLSSTRITSCVAGEKALEITASVAEDPRFKEEELASLSYQFRKAVGLDLSVRFERTSLKKQPKAKVSEVTD
jgi:exopolyphosphatase/guanosine-5'-triphosphate,3'-diphosphate pyrophosphatase